MNIQIIKEVTRTEVAGPRTVGSAARMPESIVADIRPTEEVTYVTERIEVYGLGFERTYRKDVKPREGWEAWKHEFPGEDETVLTFYPSDGSWMLADSSGYDTTSFHEEDNEKAFADWLIRKVGTER